MRELLEDLEAFSWKRCGTKLMVYKGNNHFRGNDNADVGLLRPITDFDELTFHYVDCIAVHVDHVKRQSGGAQMQPSSTLSVFQNGSVGHQPLSLIKPTFTFEGIPHHLKGYYEAPLLWWLCVALSRVQPASPYGFSTSQRFISHYLREIDINQLYAYPVLLITDSDEQLHKPRAHLSTLILLPAKILQSIVASLSIYFQAKSLQMFEHQSQ
ncbi:uncharacterized protein LOC116266102 isoform X1 [Nymphaea colorata]|nr:uncharacterized protein LOC116266102 isoform X1 [Nymphaea colorata]